MQLTLIVGCIVGIRKNRCHNSNQIHEKTNPAPCANHNKFTTYIADTYCNWLTKQNHVESPGESLIFLRDFSSDIVIKNWTTLLKNKSVIKRASTYLHKKAAYERPVGGLNSVPQAPEISFPLLQSLFSCQQLFLSCTQPSSVPPPSTAFARRSLGSLLVVKSCAASICGSDKKPASCSNCCMEQDK